MPLKSRKEDGKRRPDGGWFGSCPACLTRYAFVALLVRPSVADEGWPNRISAENMTDHQSELDDCVFVIEFFNTILFAYTFAELPADTL